MQILLCILQSRYGKEVSRRHHEYFKEAKPEYSRFVKFKFFAMIFWKLRKQKEHEANYVNLGQIKYALLEEKADPVEGRTMPKTLDENRSQGKNKKYENEEKSTFMLFWYEFGIIRWIISVKEDIAKCTVFLIIDDQFHRIPFICLHKYDVGVQQKLDSKPYAHKLPRITNAQFENDLENVKQKCVDKFDQVGLQHQNRYYWIWGVIFWICYFSLFSNVQI